MKPVMLHGHERSITQIRYNRDGDLIFSSAKDAHPNVWYSVNGERLGSFVGHGGAVWCIDVDWETRHCLTGSADNTCMLWDVETGTSVASIKTKSAVRTCGFSYSGQMIMFSTDKAMGHPCELQLFDINDLNQIKNGEPFLNIPMTKSKITSAVFGPLDQFILTGHENGELCKWDIKSGELLNTVSEHTKAINDIQMNDSRTMFITASKDTCAKLFDMSSLVVKKMYKTERPVNSAAISPTKNHVLLGGGQDAMDVTMSSSRVGKFDARFYHSIFAEEFGRVKGHFGPINSVAFHPDGKGYSSGGEDGYVRVHAFDDPYFDFELDF